jgi:hypothetical protein
MSYIAVVSSSAPILIPALSEGCHAVTGWGLTYQGSSSAVVLPYPSGEGDASRMI